jgi:translation initiation factor 3 subunit A
MFDEDRHTCACKQVKIDYQNACVFFGSQQLESERIRNHLAALARRLTHATHLVDGDTGAAAAAAAAKAAARPTPEATLAAIDLEHRTVLARKNMIEKRKEESERMLLEQEKAEEERKRDLAKVRFVYSRFLVKTWTLST